MTPESRQAALDYIARIKSRHKRDYATAYLSHLETNLGPAPDFATFGLSYMAAQAVRLTLRELTEV